ncbi:MAG: hypothetical protein H0X50_07490 [Nitrosopumilus sp.]|nr:hypothetical protein [Nitrosopumilus sp.]
MGCSDMGIKPAAANTANNFFICFIAVDPLLYILFSMSQNLWPLNSSYLHLPPFVSFEKSFTD